VRYKADATFTNVNGTFYVGREEFNRRHEEAFRKVYKGTISGDRQAANCRMGINAMRDGGALVDHDVGN
jgi:hypothetical protein